MKGLIKCFWVFCLGFVQLHGQKPEYLFYSWDEARLSQTIPAQYPETAPLLLSETRIVEFAVDAVYILQHRKIYYPSWAATTQHRGEPVQGKLLMMQARLSDTTGSVLENNTRELLVADTQQNHGLLMFGGRRPGCVLEYITVVQQAPLMYVRLKYELPPTQAVKLLLVHPQEITVAYSFTGLEAVSERLNRDEKVITQVQLTQAPSELQSRSNILPAARLVVKKTKPGFISDWAQVAMQVRQSIESPCAAKEGKHIASIYQRLRRMNPAPLNKQIMAIPGLFRREQLPYSHKALHHLLLLMDVPHELVFAADRTRSPLDTSLVFLPDISETFLWIPAVKIAITSAGRFKEALPMEYAGCTGFFIPLAAPGLPFWKQFPLPEGNMNKDQAVLIYTGNGMFQFRQRFQGKPAVLWKDYGRLSAEQRGEVDVAACRALVPEGWLLDARAQQLPDMTFLLEGICAINGKNSVRDSAVTLVVSELLLPQKPMEAFPGTLWERSLRIPLAYLEDPGARSTQDVEQVYQDAVSSVMYTMKQDAEWMELTVRISIDGCCSQRNIETGSLRLPASITLRKKAR
jgi:hypothetical protein